MPWTMHDDPSGRASRQPGGRCWSHPPWSRLPEFARRESVRGGRQSSPTSSCGQATLPAGQPVAWRVVSDVAEVAPEATFERRALGFAVNTTPFGALLVTVEATGAAFRLVPGEAAFTPDGVMQRRESLGRGPGSYLRLG